MKAFWMCYLEHGGPPVCGHQNKESAQQEAERLARKFPGRKVFLLQAVRAVVHSDVQWMALSEDQVAADPDVPF